MRFNLTDKCMDKKKPNNNNIKDYKPGVNQTDEKDNKRLMNNCKKRLQTKHELERRRRRVEIKEKWQQRPGVNQTYKEGQI